MFGYVLASSYLYRGTTIMFLYVWYTLTTYSICIWCITCLSLKCAHRGVFQGEIQYVCSPRCVSGWDMCAHRGVFQGDLLQLRLILHSHLFGLFQLLVFHAHLLLLARHLQERLDLSIKSEWNAFIYIILGWLLGWFKNFIARSTRW